MISNLVRAIFISHLVIENHTPLNLIIMMKKIPIFLKFGWSNLNKTLFFTVTMDKFGKKNPIKNGFKNHGWKNKLPSNFVSKIRQFIFPNLHTWFKNISIFETIFLESIL